MLGSRNRPPVRRRSHPQAIARIAWSTELLESRLLLAVMTDGPLTGAVTHETAKVFLRTNRSALVSVEYSTSESFADSIVTPEESTLRGQDFTRIVQLDGLQPNTTYYYRILVNGKVQATDQTSRFTTFPLPGTTADFKFAVVGDLATTTDDPSRPAPVYARIADEQPAFVLQVGDWDHRDPQTLEEMRLMHREVRGPYNAAGADFAQQIAPQFPVFHVWDDHDYGKNDGNKNFKGRTPALRAYNEYFPTPDRPNPEAGIWHQFTYGPAEFFLLDLRSQRDPNNEPDGPDKSMLDGDNIPNGQKDWLKQGLLSSTSEWKFVVSSVTFNPTSRMDLIDAWRSFQTERDELIGFVRDNNITGVVLISADLHTGGGIDNGTNTFLPELNVPHTNLPDGNTFMTGTWSEGIQPGRNPGGPGYGLVSVTDDARRVLLETRGENGELRVASMLISEPAADGVFSSFDAETGELVVAVEQPSQIAISTVDGDVAVFVNNVRETAFGSVPTGEVRSIFVQGSAGDDVIDLSRVGLIEGFTALESVRIQGSSGNDSIVGSDSDGAADRFADFILGGSGDDTINAGAGDDTLFGGDGNDLLIGKVGRDQLNGGSGDDTVNGGAGDDQIQHVAGDDRIDAGGGDDVVRIDFTRESPLVPPQVHVDGGLGTDLVSVVTSNRKDIITIAQTSPAAHHLDANGSIVDATNAETIAVDAGKGRNLVDASAAGVPVSVKGGNARDTFIGGPGNDTLIGGGENDSLLGGGGDDWIDGGGERDTLVGEAGNDTLWGGDGMDLLKGRDGNDSLAGGGDNDNLLGGGGDDWIDGDDGNDTLRGEQGHDTLRAGSGDDLLNGGDGHDGLAGGEGADTISGMAGDDTLLGGDGADSIMGGPGRDAALGEAGADFVNGQKNRDTIAGGGNGFPADIGDTLVGPEREMDELFAFEPALEWMDGV